MSDKTDLVAAFIDVRKAYRLLWVYQKRILDTVEWISEVFEERDFYWWSPTHTSYKPGSTNPMDRWVWDMLPMMQTSYLFLRSGPDSNNLKSGQWMLEIRVVADDGFHYAGGPSEPDPIDFKEPSASHSTIALYVWYCSNSMDLNWLNTMKSELSRSDGLTELKRFPIKVFGKTFDLLDFYDKAAAQERTKDFRDEASSALAVRVL